MEIIGTERGYPVYHQSPPCRTVEEYSEIESAPHEIESKSELYTRLTAIFRNHHLVIFRNHPVTVHITVFDVTWHWIAAERCLRRRIHYIFVIPEKSVGNLSISGGKGFASLCLPDVGIVRFINVDILVLCACKVAPEIH